MHKNNFAWDILGTLWSFKSRNCVLIVVYIAGHTACWVQLEKFRKILALVFSTEANVIRISNLILTDQYQFCVPSCVSRWHNSYSKTMPHSMVVGCSSLFTLESNKSQKCVWNADYSDVIAIETGGISIYASYSWLLTLTGVANSSVYRSMLSSHIIANA